MALFSGLTKAPIRQWGDFKNLLDTLTERLHERWVANVKLPPAGRWMYPVALLLTTIYFFFVSLGMCAGARVARRAKKEMLKAMDESRKAVDDAKKKVAEAEQQTARKVDEAEKRILDAISKTEVVPPQEKAKKEQED
tara:strand:- start:403 stop:816 length:414 start_codon:yes stop_codon:yes gene_type:complete